MATIVNKNNTGTEPIGTGQVIIKRSVHTPDYSTDDWFINPDLSAVDGYSTKYWKISGSEILLMTPTEIATVNDNEAILIAENEAAVNPNKFVKKECNENMHSTTSTLEQIKINLVSPTLVDGVKYVIFWSCEIGSDPFNQVEVSICLDSVAFQKQVKYQGNSKSYNSINYQTFSGFKVFDDLSGVHTFEIKYKNSYVKKGSSYIKNSSLLLMLI